ncbi:MULTISPECIES: AlpA family transcriptional regulator [Amycolatopsis]|uniref:Helix-turn-helix domain-containing protein n=1 Tax=Amycolatopsis tucumanensis TaxID=401106 RepID=A0ABP7I7H4_9PSEU|nr:MULTISPECIES: helix-turn-helix domain-containing protein [Amycolatopsis]MCF6425909.1 helix-turn-helix domain-containing protein [Amycolatopsis tucumanensis]
MTRKLLSIEDLSDYLGIPKGTLYQWRSKGYGPDGIRMGKYVRYRQEDVDAWIEQQGAA